MSRSTQHEQRLQTISNRKYVLQFGKYKGNTVQDILDNDPLYLVWLADNTDLDFSWDIIAKAQEGPQHTFTGFSSRNDPRG